MAWTNFAEPVPGPERFALPETTNRAIGAVLRRRRCALGATQKDVADGMGVSFQQLQKYESGINRISVLRLMDYCAALGVSPQEVLAEILDSCGWQDPAAIPACAADDRPRPGGAGTAAQARRR